MESQKATKQGGKHTLLMVLCCLVPLLLAGVFVMLGFRGLMLLLILLLCPLMHLFMMRGMHGEHEHGSSHSHANHSEASTEQPKE